MIDVRPLTPNDAHAYVALRREMLGDTPWAFAADEASDKGLDPVGLAKSLSGPGFAIIGAIDAGTLVGVVGLIRTNHAKMSHRVDVWGVYVTPSRRGLGLGERMMRAAQDLARTWPGVDSLRLGVSVRTPHAQRVYEQVGFVAFGIEPGCIRWQGEAIDEVHMVCVLDCDGKSPGR